MPAIAMPTILFERLLCVLCLPLSVSDIFAGMARSYTPLLHSKARMDIRLMGMQALPILR